MAWPVGIVARPIGEGDVPAWSELLVACKRVDGSGARADADDLLEKLAAPQVDAGSDLLGLWDDSRLVGYSMVWTRPAPVDVDRVWIDGRVHPSWRHRGLGRLLLEWGCSRALAAHAERNPDVPGEFQGRCNVTIEDACALFAGAGFSLARYYVGMERELSSNLPAVVEPSGLRLVPFDSRWSEATRMAHNEAFLDHWGSRRRSVEDWGAAVTGARTFRGPLSQLALDGDRVAGYVLADEQVTETGARTLYIGLVGTRRPYRGRGVARALLTRALSAGAAEGYVRATLSVDAENSTGALGLYSRLGFVVVRRTANYAKPMP